MTAPDVYKRQAYLFSRGSIGNSAAMFLMIGLMLPFFFLAMYCLLYTSMCCSATG